MCSLFINDLDAGAGRMGSSTQYTVNNQMVNATLMNIADNPTNVQLPGVYKVTTLKHTTNGACVSFAKRLLRICGRNGSDANTRDSKVPGKSVSFSCAFIAGMRPSQLSCSRFVGLKLDNI
jgi:hypothetical protein